MPPTFSECTFIILTRNGAGTEIENMIGDVNIFINDPEDLSRVELDVMIANADYRGSGCGKEAVLLMMWYCMFHLHICRFYCKIHELNERSLGLFQRFLFTFLDVIELVFSLGFSQVKYVQAFQEHELERNFSDSSAFKEYFLLKFGTPAENVEYYAYQEE